MGYCFLKFLQLILFWDGQWSIQKQLLQQLPPQFKQKMSYSSIYIRLQRESDLPLDSVQQILWDPYDRNCRTFLTCGWDGLVRLYQIEGTANKKLQKKWQYYFHHPIITMDITGDRLVIVGLASGQVGLVDMNNVNNVLLLGSHAAPVCKVVWVEKYEVVVSFGFDTVIKVFSLKNPQGNNFQISEYKLPTKTYTVSFSYPYFLIGGQDSKIALINIDKINETNFATEYQNIFDQTHGFTKFTASTLNSVRGRILLGTADGRIVSTSFTESMNGVRINKPVVNKYQKKSSYRKELVGQVNGLDFGIKENKHQFAIFCGTEEMGIYSPDKSMKIKTLGTSNTSVTAVSISPDCEYYAFAVGTDWNKGLEELSLALPIKINVGRLSNSDVVSTTSSYVR